MSGFAIYLPGLIDFGQSELETLGVWDLCTDKFPETSPISQHGPDGGSGCLLCWRVGNIEIEFPLSVDLDKQDWEKAPGKDYWIGFLKDRHPTPMDLMRQPQFGGIETKLSDQQTWLIPVAKDLPHKSGVGEDGKYRRIVDDRFRDYFQKTEGYILALFAGATGETNGDGNIEISLSDTYEFSSLALSINYRLNRELISVLEILDDAAMIEIIRVASDYAETLHVLEQKKTADLTSIPAG